MSMLKRSSVFVGAIGLALAAFTPAHAQKELTILESVPGLNFPFFVHMMNQMKAEAEALGNITVIESDGQDQTPKQTADVETAIIQGVDGIVISPSEVDAMAPAMQQAVDAGIPVVTIDRRVDKVPGILAHVGADNVKGGEAQGELIMKLFPDGATIINLQGTPGASPAIDRNKGLHNVLDTARRQVQVRLRADRQLPPRRRPVGDRVGARRHGRAAGRHRRRQRRHVLGAIEALKARNLAGVVTSSASTRCPRRWSQVRDGSLTATVEQFPGGQSRGAVQALVEVPARRHEARAAGPADAGRDHQGQPQQGRAPRRGAVDGSAARPRPAPIGAGMLVSSRASPDSTGEGILVTAMTETACSAHDRASASASPACWRSTASTSRSRPARSTRCSARTAPASRRC